MVILGAGGFAKEILQVVEVNYPNHNIAFYDDRTPDIKPFIFEKYPILRNKEELTSFFKSQDPHYVVGIGNSKARELLIQLADTCGGVLTDATDKDAKIGKYSTIGLGATILSHATISNSATIGKAVLAYYNTVVAHDCLVGDFVELSPGATLLGNVQVGNYTQIGANATILPRIKVGSNCIVGSGAVVTKNVPDNCIVAGVPARIIKQNCC